MIYLTYLAVILLFIGYILNIKKNKYSWVVWIICSVIWCYYALETDQMTLFYNSILCLFFECWGFFSWRKDAD